jgi:molybdate transport system ATP-binding protein
MTSTQTLRIEAELALPGFKLKLALGLPLQGITVIFGPSGSGKTSLLRCLAGLERPTGRIALGPEVWQDSPAKVFQPTWKRRIGMVFQEASLFEHLDVRQNLRFGLRRGSAPSDTRLLDSVIERLGISGLLDRSVGDLSGGERQRVAIARALATRPDLLLLDEPLASLDVARRKELVPWLENLHRDLSIPVVLVTHSVAELTRLADHLVWLDRGAVRAQGPIAATLGARAFAQSLDDEACMILNARVDIDPQDPQGACLVSEAGLLWSPDRSLRPDQPVRIRIFARDVGLTIRDGQGATSDKCLAGFIEWIEPNDRLQQVLVSVRCGQERLLSLMNPLTVRRLALESGQPVWCEIRSLTVFHRPA